MSADETICPRCKQPIRGTDTVEGSVDTEIVHARCAKPRPQPKNDNDTPDPTQSNAPLTPSARAAITAISRQAVERQFWLARRRPGADPYGDRLLLALLYAMEAIRAAAHEAAEPEALPGAC